MLLAGELKIKGLVPEQVFNETAKAQNASSEDIDDEPVNKEASEDEKTPKAKKLKIKGLSSGKAFIEPSMLVQETVQETIQETVQENEEGITLDESTAGYQVMQVESETIAFEEKVRVRKDTSHFIKEFVSDVSELEEKIETMMAKGEKGFLCKMCENYAGTRQHVIYHIEANHVEGLKHLCTECNRYYKVRNPCLWIYAKSLIIWQVRHSLQSHIKRKHKKGAIPTLPADLTTLQESLKSLKEEMI